MVKKFTNPNDPMGPIAMEAPVSAGLVLSEQNLPKILRRMAEFGPTENDSPAKYAYKYIAAKYPKLFGLPEHIALQGPNELGLNQLGRYLPESNTVQLSSSAPRSNAAGALAHELTHALQKYRGESFKNYIPFTGSNEMEYLSQPVEEQARQAGQTAQRTFFDFLAKIKEMRMAQGK